MFNSITMCNICQPFSKYFIIFYFSYTIDPKYRSKHLSGLPNTVFSVLIFLHEYDIIIAKA